MTNGEGETGGEQERAGQRHNRPVRPADEPVLRYTFVSSYFLASSAPSASLFSPFPFFFLSFCLFSFFSLFIAKVLVREGTRSRCIYTQLSLVPPPFARLYVTPNLRVPGRVPRGRRRVHASRLNELFVYFPCTKWLSRRDRRYSIRFSRLSRFSRAVQFSLRSVSRDAAVAVDRNRWKSVKTDENQGKVHRIPVTRRWSVASTRRLRVFAGTGTSRGSEQRGRRVGRDGRNYRFIAAK